MVLVGKRVSGANKVFEKSFNLCLVLPTIIKLMGSDRCGDVFKKMTICVEMCGDDHIRCNNFSALRAGKLQRKGKDLKICTPSRPEPL